MRSTDSDGGYFFFGFGAGECGFFYDLRCVFSACGNLCKLVAFCETSLNGGMYTFPRSLPLRYLLMTVPFLFFSSTMFSSWLGGGYLAD
jgi:hypothetical protein